MNFSYRKKTDLAFTDALTKVREELHKNGFGIITEIDVKETFKKKLNIEYDNYQILGACHPNSAYQVLEADKLLGLMLPCNVIVYEKDGEIFVATVLPTKILNIVNDEKLMKIANEIEVKLRKVVDEI